MNECGPVLLWIGIHGFRIEYERCCCIGFDGVVVARMVGGLWRIRAWLISSIDSSPVCRLIIFCNSSFVFLISLMESMYIIEDKCVRQCLSILSRENLDC